MERNTLIDIFKKNRVFDDKFFMSPNIPHKKALNAINAHRLERLCRPDDILFLADNTVFGSAKEGIIISDKYISYKAIFEESVTFEIDKIKGVHISGRKIYIDREEIDLHMAEKSGITSLYYAISDIIENNSNVINEDEGGIASSIDDKHGENEANIKYRINIIDNSYFRDLSTEIEREIRNARGLRVNGQIIDQETHRKLLKISKKMIDYSLLYKEKFLEKFPSVDLEYKYLLNNSSFTLLNLIFLFSR